MTLDEAMRLIAQLTEELDARRKTLGDLIHSYEEEKRRRQQKLKALPRYVPRSGDMVPTQQTTGTYYDAGDFDNLAGRYYDREP